jgi:hypothetical protein
LICITRETAGLATKFAYQGITDTATISSGSPHIIKQVFKHTDYIATPGPLSDIGILRVRKSINQSINQSINLSINQSINRL